MRSAVRRLFARSRRPAHAVAPPTALVSRCCSTAPHVRSSRVDAASLDGLLPPALADALRDAGITQPYDSRDSQSPTTTVSPAPSVVSRAPRDSRVTIVLPFGSDPAFRAKFVNFRSHVRVGMLLEEIDALAGAAAYLHVCGASHAPGQDVPVCVTASLDRVDLLHYPLPADADMRMQASVSYAGVSSMNVDVECTVPQDAASGGARCFLRASLTFVARDRGNASLPVPTLRTETPEEQAAYERGRHANIVRKRARDASLLKIPPTAEELALVHTLFMELARTARRDAFGDMLLPRPSAGERRMLFMEHTRISSTIVTMPQQMNIHGRIFGGFLMREAFEVAWACGWAVTGVVPKFLSVDNVAFLRPVEVGKLLRFDAQMDHTDARADGSGGKILSVSVSATMMEPGAAAAAQSTTTTTFHFTLYCDAPERTPRIMPRTYEDAMRYIDAHRRQQLGAALDAQRKASGVP